MKQKIKKWLPLFVLGLALSIIIIDTTLLNVSLSAIITDLHTDIQSLQWVIAAYSLTMAALTITGGRLGDLFGRKNMFVVGAVIFAIGSFIASISTNIPVLLLGESLIEGIGAALMMPATASLLVSNYEGKDRGIAFGIWGGLAGASSAIGPILGGYLTKYYSWRWGFRINVVVALILVLGSFLIQQTRSSDKKPQLDTLGVFLSAIGLLGIVFGIIQSSSYGWWTAKDALVLFGTTITPFGLSVVPFSLLLGAIFLVVFGWWENKLELVGKTPLVSLKLFKNKVFSAGVLTTAIISLGQVGLIFALPVFLQSVLKLDAFNTGLTMLPLSIALLIMAPISGILSNKVPAKYIIMAGLVIDIIAMFLIRHALHVGMNTAELIPGQLLYGMGMGMVMAQISNVTLSAVPIEEAGEASGINNTFRQIGSSLGSAIIGAVLLSSLTVNVTTNIQQSTTIPSQIKSQFVEAVKQQKSNIEFGGVQTTNKAIPQPVIAEMSKITNKATADAAQLSMIYAAVFALMGLIASLTLPAVKLHGRQNAKPSGGH
jgi:EmrB/QacA subfamily drug resistance transporter